MVRHLILLVPVAVLAAGCGSHPGPTEVTGSVLMDNQPLAGAHVEFVPAGDDLSLGAFGAVTDDQGRFKAEVGGPGRAAKAGRFKVLVTKGAGFTPAALPPAKAGSDDEEARTKELMKKNAPKGPGGPAPRGTLPAKYAYKESTPFEVEVKVGATELEPLRLEGKPGS